VKEGKNMSYGDNIKQQRLLKGKSLLQVEKETGISNQNLSRWERNEVLPNIDFCVKLAKYYGVTIEELIGVDL
jgi:transcriptional regulator with XRE-family HTH domain